MSTLKIKRENGKIFCPLADSWHIETPEEKRCLRLLKKGGRMGMVLPEGVLNTSNLQKIREYFEGKAKIIHLLH